MVFENLNVTTVLLDETTLGCPQCDFYKYVCDVVQTTHVFEACINIDQL